MNVTRGDVVLAVFPHAAGGAPKRRPVLVVQSDVYNQTIRNTIVAEITSNLRRASDPAHLLIEVTTPDGQQSGLLRDSIVSCINLATLRIDRIDRAIGRLSDDMMQQIENCLKSALALP
jgi:mRNA interferase MazF